MRWLPVVRRGALLLLLSLMIGSLTIGMLACSSEPSDVVVEQPANISPGSDSSGTGQSVASAVSMAKIGVLCGVVSTDEVRSITGIGQPDKPVSAVDSSAFEYILACDWGADEKGYVFDRSNVVLAGELVSVAITRLASDEVLEDHIFFSGSTFEDDPEAPISEFGDGAYRTAVGGLTRVQGMFVVDVNVLVNNADSDFEAAKALSELIVSRLP
jgi:hypothetical protein